MFPLTGLLVDLTLATGYTRVIGLKLDTEMGRRKRPKKPALQLLPVEKQLTFSFAPLILIPLLLDEFAHILLHLVRDSDK